MRNKAIFFSLLMLLAIGLTGGLLQFLPAMATYGTDLLRVAIGITVFFVIDKYVMADVDTFEELKKGNIAYALFVLSYAIIIGLSLSSM